MDVYGIATCEKIDITSEVIDLESLNTNNFTSIIDEHAYSIKRVVGAITFSKKIFSSDECSTPEQLELWNTCNAPFLYFEGKLLDHQDGQSVQELMTFIEQNPQHKMQMRCSIDGYAVHVKNTTFNGQSVKQLLKHMEVLSVALTVRPVNKYCLVKPKQMKVTKSKNQKTLKEVIKHMDYETQVKILNESLDIQIKKLKSEIDSKVFSLKVEKSIKNNKMNVCCGTCGKSTTMDVDNLINTCSSCGEYFYMDDFNKAVR